jgi:hypothetical protein
MGGNAILFYHLNLLSAKEYTVEALWSEGVCVNFLFLSLGF